jgi:hypothetical protein
MNIGKRILLKSRISRKSYKCDMCTDTIEIGEHYTSVAFVNGGYHINWKCCLRHSWKSINQRVKDIRVPDHLRE